MRLGDLYRPQSANSKLSGTSVNHHRLTYPVWLLHHAGAARSPCLPSHDGRWFVRFRWMPVLRGSLWVRCPLRSRFSKTVPEPLPVPLRANHSNTTVHKVSNSQALVNCIIQWHA